MCASVEIPPRVCPLCGADNRAQPPGPYSEPPWRLKTCAKCGFAYLENPPDYFGLEQDFAWEKTSAAEESRRKTERPLGKRISGVFRNFRQKVLKRDKLLTLLRGHLARGRVLDVGCGGGGVIARLPDCYEPLGVEISQVLSKQADALARKKGGRVVQGNAIAGIATFEAGSIDGALLSGFLEHEIQPALLLRNLLAVLKPGAPVIVKVPNYASLNRLARGAKWCGFRHPDHVNYFTPASLEELALECGFRVARCTLGDCWPFSDNLWMVLEKPGARN